MTMVSPSTPLTPSTPVTVVIPSYNEADNVEELIARLDSALAAHHAPARDARAEVLYVDDSTDDTPAKVREAAALARHLDVRVLHRDEPTGGLAGAVVTGLREARGAIVVVMDGDLQHPPETVPTVLAAFDDHVDVVVASRHVAGGSSDGLSGSWREWASAASTLVARWMFPRRLRGCTDPMTGFFAVRTDRLDLGLLRPRGFKILLEVLASQPLFVEQVPLAFTDRTAGQSKATWRVGVTYLRQLLSLRFRNRMLRFAAVGALGTVANIALMVALMHFGVHYLPASIVAAEATILGNFLVQEVFVFGDLTGDGTTGSGRRGTGRWWGRVATWFGFNNVELAVRTPMLVAVVESSHVPVSAAQSVLLGAMFLVRFVFTRYVVYALPGRRRAKASSA
jgi:dolichol-phosphate mannosyltransferase